MTRHLFILTTHTYDPEDPKKKDASKTKTPAKHRAERRLRMHLSGVKSNMAAFLGQYNNVFTHCGDSGGPPRWTLCKQDVPAGETYTGFSPSVSESYYMDRRNRNRNVARMPGRECNLTRYCRLAPLHLCLPDYTNVKKGPISSLVPNK